jgi:ATP adenylyltransferase
MEYIEGTTQVSNAEGKPEEENGKPKGCVFCLTNAAPNTGNKAKDSEVTSSGESVLPVIPIIDNNPHLLYSGKLSTVILNKFPYNSGHILVSPKRHTASLPSLSIEEMSDLMRLVTHSVKALTEAYAPEGFNIGMNLGKSAGAGIAEHLHWHVLPRWNGDTNFMTTLADIRVIPEHIEAARRKLLPYFDAL